MKYFLEHCLLSVEKACEGIKAEVFVVDNNSTDGSIEYLEPRFPHIHFFRNKENVGFAKANNSVLSHTKGDHILFLNPDTILPEDCLKKCIDLFRSAKDCGALGVRMIDGSGNFLRESKRNLPGIFSAFYKTIGLTNTFPRSKIFAAYYAGHLPENETNRTEVLAGAFMMLSRKALELTKGFDEDFFMYGEDVDLSYRILKAGLHNYYFPETTIIHFKGESTGKETKQYRKNFYGAMRLFAEKHYSNNLKNFFIGLGIKLAEMASSLKSVNKNNTTRQSFPAFVIGNETESFNVNAILQDVRSYTVRQVNSIEMLRNEADKFPGIIFCEGSRKHKENINDLERLSNKMTAMFYTSGAKSIIGSHDKNSKGFFIATT